MDRRYPWESKEKRMTIAAGFVCRDGILLCADSQYTGGWEKTFREKVFARPLGAVMLSFALAGDETFGRTVIDECCLSVSTIPRTEQTIWNVRKSIRRTLKQELKDCPADIEKPQFLIAITTLNESILFSTREHAMPRVQDYEFLGTGGYIGKHLMQPFGPFWMRSIGLEEALLMGLNVLTAAKRTDLYCGGGSQFLAVRASTRGFSGMEIGGPSSIQLPDSQMAQYEHLASALLMFMGNLTMADEQFQQQLIGFCAEVTKLREQMREPGSHYRALAEMVRQVGKEHLESTTPDPSGQPPSQAPPGGSDES